MMTTVMITVVMNMITMIVVIVMTIVMFMMMARSLPGGRWRLKMAKVPPLPLLRRTTMVDFRMFGSV